MIRLEKIFADGMVLQAGKPVRVFGWCDSVDYGKKITAEIGGKHGECVPGESFIRWVIELPSFGYGENYSLTVACGEQKIVVNDIVFGDVLLCSGQSNMQFTMSEEVTPESEYEDDSLLRVFCVTRPETNSGWGSDSGWIKCEKSIVNRWSALGYLTGIRHRKNTGHAVGVVVSCQGASVIQSWMNEKALDNPSFDIPDDQLFGDHHYEPYLGWNGRTMLYKSMLEPLLPYSFHSVIWYQGESNASPAEGKVYLDMLAAMIKCWREGDRDDSLPFVVIQIADTRTDEGWLAIQKAQLGAESIPHVRLVKCADICEREMIHPVTKYLLADRIADVLPVL